MLPFIFLASASAVYATTHHVFGSDISPETAVKTSAWKSLNEVDMSLLKSGDVVQFCGQVFGSAKITVPEVKLTACSTGAVLSNSVPVNATWTVYKDNIMMMPLEANVQQLIVDGQSMVVARYPNLLSIKDRTGSNTQEWLNAVNNVPMDTKIWQIPLLNRSAGYWNGATVRARSKNWIYESSLVKESTQDSITFDPPVTFAPSNGTKPGVYFEKWEELDQPGEWWSDGKTLYYYPLSDITKSKIEYIPKGVIMTIAANNIVIEGLNFTNAQGAISLDSGVDSTLIKNNVIRGMTQFGISQATLSVKLYNRQTGDI
jgi:hypothetical protein